MTDLHERFSAWLDASPDRDPPRDMAVHAAFCPDCQQRIAARDALAVIDLGAADRLVVAPFAAASSTTSGPLNVGSPPRILAAIVLVGATGFMLVQSVDLAPASGTGGTAASSSAVPVGAVLGATGTPVPSVTPSMEPRRKEVSSAAARAAQPSDTTTAEPVVSVPIAPTTAPPATAAPVTPEPTASASLAPTASVAPSASAPPTSTPVLSPTATPTQPATESPAPTPTESPAGTTTP